MDYMTNFQNNFNKIMNKYSTSTDDILSNYENARKWDMVYLAYSQCAQEYLIKNQIDNANKCLDKLGEIQERIFKNEPFNPNFLNNELLTPYGGSQKLLEEINQRFGSPKKPSRITPTPISGGLSSPRNPIYPPSISEKPTTFPEIPPSFPNPYPDGKKTTGTDSKSNSNNKNHNPYGFNFTELTEEDKLESYIKAGLPIFLHGKSGCGKSARIKEIDPECEVIYLGSSRPETLLGKSIVVNNELQDVPPTWYTNLCEKCKREPDRDHILFFDEMTNATPALQSYAFNIILDKEINGKWKLPDNVKIVAAGNETKESLSANKISEPLFRRFNHIYIETTLEKWLLWASKHNIHPAIYAYVASKGDGEYQVLRTECDGKNPCVDPRKWEMASQILYKNKNPKVLTAALGEKITEDFIEFCKRPVITLEQVLTDNYDHNMGILSIDDGFATLIGLSACNDSDIEKVRDFVKKHVIPDQYQNFVMMWTRGDKNRIDKIQELDLEEQLQPEKRKR